VGNLFSKLVRIGSSGHKSEIEVRRIVITNGLALICLAYLSLRSVIYFQKSINLGIIYVVSAFSFLFVLYLNHLKKHNLAKTIFISLANSFIFLLNYFFLGVYSTSGPALFWISCMIPMMIFDFSQKKYIIFLAGESFVALLTLLVLNYFYPSRSILSGLELEASKWVVFGFGMLIAFFSAYYFYRINEILDHNLVSANEELKNKNQEILLKQIQMVKKSQLIENDLVMARKIHENLLPQYIPDSNIAFYYKSMHELGGDFINFIKFSPDKTGIFISDVSGHGLSSAFITLMLKNLLEGYQVSPSHPENMLLHINDYLLNKLAENFITAFLGVYDRKKREFVYANAGHCLPFHIHKNGISKLITQSRGYPLGIQDSKSFLEANKYKSHKIKLAKDDLLFFYTDGITEARPIGDTRSKDYEIERLNHTLKVIYEIPEIKPDTAIDYLLKDLVNYRKSSDFEDDICMCFLKVQ